MEAILGISKITHRIHHGAIFHFMTLEDHEQSDNRFILAGHFNEEVKSHTIAEGKTIIITDGRMIKIDANSFVILVVNLEIVGTLTPTYIQARCLRDQGERVNFINMPIEQLREILHVDQTRARTAEGLLKVILEKACNESVDTRTESRVGSSLLAPARVK